MARPAASASHLSSVMSACSIIREHLTGVSAVLSILRLHGITEAASTQRELLYHFDQMFTGCHLSPQMFTELSVHFSAITATFPYMAIRQMPDAIFSHFRAYWSLKMLVSPSRTPKIVQFMTLRHPSPELPVVILQYTNRLKQFKNSL